MMGFRVEGLGLISSADIIRFRPPIRSADIRVKAPD
jgi:hypothetical protein